MSHHSIEHTMLYVQSTCRRCGEDLLQTMRHACFGGMTEERRAVWIIAVIIAARDVVIGNKVHIWDDTDLDFFEEWERQLFVDRR